MNEKMNKRYQNPVPRVLVVDDEADIRELLELTLAKMGLSADSVGSVAEAKKLLENNHYNLCLTDMRLPDGEGLDVVKWIGMHHEETPVAVITAYGSMSNAVTALKAGAFDYLSKPVSLEQLRTLVKSAISLPQAEIQLDTEESCGQLVGVSMAIDSVREMIKKLARSQAPVYISGESGTGKELAACLVHYHSARKDAPFIPVNCGAIPENLVESEFFGYRKGAFTGADSDREGFFQVADKGTLFLDEVADLPLSMQVKLLRAIQEKKIRKIGNATEDAVDVRIICATHKKLKECVDAGTFRQDLYYRLNVIELKMPPLRERPEDIPSLVEAMLKRIDPTAVITLRDDAMNMLLSYTYPGNVRELENILERATALCSDAMITPEDLQLSSDDIEKTDANGADSLDEQLSTLEKQIILDALSKTGNNRTAAARLLGITFRSLRYRLERLGIDHL